MTTIPTRTLLPRPGRQYDQRSERQRNELVERRLRQIMARFDTIETELERLEQVKADKAWVASEFVETRYGAISLETPTAIADIPTTGWVDVPFDSDVLATPDGVVQDSANDQIIVTKQGIIGASIMVNVSHTDSNQGRTFQLAVWDKTNDVQIGFSNLIFTGRNQDGSFYTETLLFDVPGPLVNVPVGLRVGNASAAYTGVQMESANFVVGPAGEWTGIIP